MHRTGIWETDMEWNPCCHVAADLLCTALDLRLATRSCQCPQLENAYWAPKYSLELQRAKVELWHVAISCNIYDYLVCIYAHAKSYANSEQGWARGHQHPYCQILHRAASTAAAPSLSLPADGGWDWLPAEAVVLFKDPVIFLLDWTGTTVQMCEHQMTEDINRWSSTDLYEDWKCEYP